MCCRAYATHPQMANSLRSPLLMMRLRPVYCCDASYSSCTRQLAREIRESRCVGLAYDGDDVPMLILAGVGLLFPLHDCDERATMFWGWVKEAGGMVMGSLFKGCRTRV